MDADASNPDGEGPVPQPAPTAVQPAQATAASARQASEGMNREAFLSDLESSYLAVRAERDRLKSSAEEGEAEAERLRRNVAELRAAVAEKDGELDVARRRADGEGNKRGLAEEAMRMADERVDRTAAEADALREEISRLSESKNALAAKLSEVETSTTLTAASAVPLRLEADRLKTELGSVTAHCGWLSDELDARAEALTALRTQRATEVSELTAKADSARYELDEAKARLAASRTREEAYLVEIEDKQERLRAQARDAAGRAEANEAELLAERNLSRANGERAERLASRYETMRKEMESMKRLAQAAAEDAMTDLDRLEKEAKERGSAALVEAEQRHGREIEEMEARLKEAEEGRKRIEDGLLNSPTPLRRRRSTIAAKASEANDGADTEGPMSLMDLYEAKAALEDELLYERRERARLELYLKKVQLDIEAKTPEIRRRHRAYEVAIRSQDELQARLSDALEEAEIARAGTASMTVENGRLTTECRELRTENIDLASQVQALLCSQAGERRESAGNGIVEFDNIKGLQERNQQLIREHRRLSDTITDLEQKIKKEPLQISLTEKEEELFSLREERERQANLVAGIVQQRDLYRALLAKHDGKLIEADGGEEESDSMVAADRAAALGQENKKLSDEVARISGALTSARNSNNELEERLARLDAHATDLSTSVHRLNGSITAANADAARAAADASYHQERCIRLEQQAETLRLELSRSVDARKELDSINSSQQKSLAEARAGTAKAEMQLQQSESKLRLAETQIKTVRASESRLGAETNSLRAELSRQGTLLDSVQRIEASLSAKSATDIERLEEDMKRNLDLLSSERANHAAEIEKLQGNISDLEILSKEQEAKKNEALSNMVKAKEDVVQARSDFQALSERCAGLELALSQAKRKLGEADDVIDDEDKLASLGAELESVRTELAVSKERMEDLQAIAKSNEASLVEMTKASGEYKKKAEFDLQNCKDELSAARRSVQTKQEMLDELGKDLAGSRGEQEKAVSDLKGKIEGMQAEVISSQQDAEAAKARMESLETEMRTYQADALAAQNNYERELALHASARTDLRNVRAEQESDIRHRQTAQSQLETVKAEFEGESKIYEETKTKLEESVKEAEKRLEEARNQNDILHSQMETLTASVEKYQNEKMEDASDGTPKGEVSADLSEGGEEVAALRKTINDLREMVRFLRSEREMYEAQLESARRTSDRERAASAITKRSLEEARAELQIRQNDGDSIGKENAKSVKEREVDAAKLKKAEDQLVLLRESNQLLREGNEKTAKSLQLVEKELSERKSSAAPTEAKCRHFEVRQAGLEAEKASLAREVDAWKARVQSLVSKFNTVDPEEHKKALAELEAFKNKYDSVQAEKERASKESTSVKALVSRLNKESTQLKAQLESTKVSLAKTTMERNALTKKSSAADSTFSKERLQLKQNLQKKDTALATAKADLAASNSRIESLKKIMGKMKQNMEDKQKESMAAAAKQQAAVKALEKKKAELSMLQKEPSDTPGASAPMSEWPKSSGEITDTVPALSSASEPMPKVPEGGFKFAPSSVSKSDIGTVSKPPLGAPTPSITTAKRPAPKGSVAKEGLVAIADLSKEGEVPAKTTIANVAPTKENKLSAMREKLLRKKRQLEVEMAKKGDADKLSDESPPVKRAALASKETSPLLVNKPTDSKMEMPKSPPNSTEGYSKAVAEKNPPSEEDGKQDPQTEMMEDGKTTVLKSKPLSTAAAPFGSSSGGASFLAGATKAPAFGSVGMSGFSASASRAAPVFGSASTATAGVASAFGSKAPTTGATPAVVGGGKTGTFLDLKPPSASPPGKFVFGNSESITLPTPNKSPPSQPVTGFATFGKPSPFGTSVPNTQSTGTAFGSTAASKQPIDEAAESPKLNPEEVTTTTTDDVDDHDKVEGGEVEE